MNIDDKLREILQAEADGVRPGAEGWDRIRAGITARRRRTAWLRSGAVLTTGLAVVATVLAVRAGEPSGVQPSDASPSATTSSRPLPPTTDDFVPLVWPFASREDIAEWWAARDRFPWANDPTQVAAEFAEIYLGIPNPTVVRDPDPAATTFTVHRTVEGKQAPVAVVTLSDLGSAGAFWVVAGVRSDAVTVTAPDPNLPLVSPVVVRGTTRAVDSPIDVELRAAPDAAGRTEVIGKARATVGPEGWSATLRFEKPPSGAGSIRVTTASGADGGIASASVLRVVFTQNPNPVAMPKEFYGIQGGRLATFSSETGERLEFLTDERPGGGVTEVQATGDGRLVYAAGEGNCRAGGWVVDVAGGAPTQIAPADQGAVQSVSMNELTKQFAYLVVRCVQGGEDVDIVVTNPLGQEQRRIGVPAGSRGPIRWSGRNVLVLDSNGTLRAVDSAGERPDAVLRPPGGCSYTAVTGVRTVSADQAGGVVGVQQCADGATLFEADDELKAAKPSTPLGRSTVVSLDLAHVPGTFMIMLRGDNDSTVEALDGRGDVIPVTTGVQSPTW